MSLKETITQQVKEAMKAKQTARLATLRFLQAAIKQKEVDERVELSDGDVLAIIEKQIKQRKESISAFEAAGRTETAEAEKAELAVLSEFLPEQASDEELMTEIKAALAEVAAQGVTGAPAMGKAMAILKPKLAGRADMGKVSQLLKAAL
ncbi:aspartyl-tRNA amidotransferase subunit B [Pelistega indica]|uniref:Aspartyl-tRNA amidotransferase subunit B n=1 Tax=Pelistega indica TaxID=1414851 RepID=V8FX15_9BURK|nr:MULTISPECIES: GatB/YqeY domain-containing protein [Pelistega]ETD68710.1 aspartyl-tRNA amidotransferase subunit B [Pelistega indica]